MNIKKEIMEELIKELEEIGETSQFGQEFDCKALIKWLNPKLSLALTRVEAAAYREGMVYKGKAVREAYEHGYREGIHEGYNQKMEELTPSEEKELGNHAKECSFIKYDTGICDCPQKEGKKRKQ